MPSRLQSRLYEDELKGLPKKERKALQREFARIQREEEQKRRRRNRIVLRTSLVTVGVAALAVTALVIVTNVRAGLAGPANMASDGILFTGDGTNMAATTNAALKVGDSPTATTFDLSKGVLTVVDYVDYSNADSMKFEATNSAALEGYVKQGAATLEIHPVAFSSTDSNSAAVRTANAMACVANAVPDSVPAVHAALVADAATITTTGITDDELVALVTKAGITDPTVTPCITKGEYDNWVTDVTNRARAGIPNADESALSAVPTVVIDGYRYIGAVGDSAAFTTFVSDTYAKVAAQQEAASGTTGSTGSTGTTDTPGTPTPTPTSTTGG